MKTVVDVHNVLGEKNIPHEVIPLSCPTSSAERMSEILNLSPSAVIKSVLFIIDGGPLLVLLSAKKRVCYKKLKRAVEASSLRLATPQELVDITGYMLGATPPVAHKVSIRTIMDEELNMQNVIYTSAGELNTVLKMRASDLKEAACAEAYNLTEG